MCCYKESVFAYGTQCCERGKLATESKVQFCRGEEVQGKGEIVDLDFRTLFPTLNSWLN